MNNTIWHKSSTMDTPDGAAERWVCEVNGKKHEAYVRWVTRCGVYRGVGYEYNDIEYKTLSDVSEHISNSN